MSKQIILPSSRYASTTTKATVYDDPTKAHQSFDGIRFIQAAQGDLILRGRHGMRDVLVPLRKSFRMFQRALMLYANLHKISPYIVSQMKDVLIDFGNNILQAIKFRESHNIPLPPQATPLRIAQIKSELQSGLASFSA